MHHDIPDYYCDVNGFVSFLKQRSDSYDIRESMSVHCGYALCSFFLLFFFGVKFSSNRFLFLFVLKVGVSFYRGVSKTW